MQLPLTQIRFRFLALESLRFPPFRAGSILRGALGTHLRPDLYREFLHVPKPWVLRVAQLNAGQLIESGRPFEFAIHLFDNRPEIVNAVVDAYRALELAGVGSPRSLVRMLEAEVRDASTMSIPGGEQPAYPQETDQLTVEFATPTAFEQRGEVLSNAPFNVVAIRAHQRLVSLCTRYGDGQVPPFVPSAALITACKEDLTWVDCMRKSRHSQGAQSLSGFVGKVTYQGQLQPFLPLLQAAMWTGIGRATSFGNGQIRLIRAGEIR